MAPPHQKTFLTLEQFQAAHTAAAGATAHRMVHCVNPFPAQPGSEHHRAQNVTFHSMSRAREVARALAPEMSVQFVSIPLEHDIAVEHIRFDEIRYLTRSISDLHRFQVERPLPLIFDILEAAPAEPDDILIFTNVDIALVPGFYLFLAGIFQRGVDAVAINRRTISGGYAGVEDYDVMACETGEPHPGFDCFAFRAGVRNDFIRSDSCVGIGLVMLPLLHNLLALAKTPAVLLDAHATFHLGNDRQWRSDSLADYSDHNRREMHKTFEALTADVARRDRLVARLQDAHKPWVFPDILRQMIGEPLAAPAPSGRLHTLARKARRRFGTTFGGGPP